MSDNYHAHNSPNGRGGKEETPRPSRLFYSALTNTVAVVWYCELVDPEIAAIRNPNALAVPEVEPGVRPHSPFVGASKSPAADDPVEL